MTFRAAGRRLRVFASTMCVAVAALRVAALAQTGCVSPRTDGAWRNAVRATVEHRGGEARVEAGARWVRRCAAPAPFREVSDLAGTPRGLVLSASIDALTVDGAALFRCEGAATPRELLRWDGQGFLRVHAWGDTLLVPDADAPFHALSFAFDLDVDGYVFASSPDGTLTERQREVLPAAYHVFDVARLSDGTLVASTGAYPPSSVAYLSSHAPAALYRDDGAERPWRRVLEHPSSDAAGVYRFTFLETLSDGALLAGTETPTGPGAVRIEGLPNAPRVVPVEGIDGYVLRWARWRDAVLAVVQGAAGTTLLRSDDGGRRFVALSAPAMPQNVVANERELFVLADGALYSSADGVTFTERAAREPGLAHRASSLVSAPIAVWRGHVWAASTRTGEVFEAR